MRVQSIKKDYSKPYNPGFKAVFTEVYKKSLTNPSGIELKHKNTSWIFRPEIWSCKKFYNHLSEVFRNTDKVSVYSYGCSLGYEAYSMIMWFLSGKKKNPEKFFPITAKDYDEDVINNAVKYRVPLDSYETSNINFVTKNHIDRFFSMEHFTDVPYSIGIPTDLLTQNVNFSVADIRDDYININPENSVVMACNFWPYIPKEDRTQLAENLYKQLWEKSLLKIGNFDDNQTFLKDDLLTSQLLRKVGFKPTSVAGLFKR